MKRIKLYEEYITSLKEGAMQVTPESDVMIDDYTTDDGQEIKSAEIVGAIVSSKTEKEFKDYFYDQYGLSAFTENDLSTLVKYYNEYTEELNAKEAEEEEKAKEEEEGGEDSLGDMGDIDV